MFKDLMVHLDGTSEDAVRIAHAEALSARFGEARITGLYTHPLPEYAYVLGVQSEVAFMAPVLDLEDKLRREGDAVVARLRERLFRPGASHDIRRIDAWPSAIPALAASEARCADLFIATTPYREATGDVWNRLVEAVLFESGRALYLLPPDCDVRGDIRSIVLAWKDTREAARAVREGLPFLQQANLVYLLGVNESKTGEDAAQSADLAAYLDRNGVKVEIVIAKASAAWVWEIIQEQVSRLGADLMVMGAYGHSRFRELVLGGATRDLIERSRIPLLLAH